MTEIIDCRAIALAIKNRVIKGLTDNGISFGKGPKAAFILVGDDELSARYVGIKNKICAESGIRVENIHFSSSVSRQELESTIISLNKDKEINGILVQMPLPKHIDEFKIKNAIDCAKDVDGLSAENMFNTMFGRGGHVPCLPGGILRILKLYGINPSEKTVVIAGKSDITSAPLLNVFANLCSDVIFTDRGSKNLSKLVAMADIVVSCCNRAHIIKSEWLAKNSIAFDAGNTSVKDLSKQAGYRVVGDVEFNPEVCAAKYITPVPGGLGPLSTAMLASNIFDSYLASRTAKKIE